MEKRKERVKFSRQLPLLLMLIPPMILVLIFCYGPMLGIVMAFQDYLPMQGWYVFGSEFVGLEHFRTMFSDPKILQIFRNTVVIALAKIVSGILITVVLAILMNEINQHRFKKTIQTIIFLPHFISWVILSSLITRLFSVDNGYLTNLFAKLGMTMPDFFGNPGLFPVMMVLSHLWKEAGWGAIVYLAAITTIDSNLYEAAAIDGAGRLRATWFVTLPGMLPIIVLMTVLNMGNILSAGFEQVYNMYNTVVYSTGDILDTYVYRIAFKEGSNYSFATAVGLFKSVVSLAFVSGSYWIAYKTCGYKIF